MRLAQMLTASIALLWTIPASADVTLDFVGRYETGIYADGASEISAHDPAHQRIFTTNGNTGNIDVLDISDPANPVLDFVIDLSAYGVGANSVAVHHGIVAVAVEDFVRTDNGHAVFFDTDGNFIRSLEVGALPDMITFTKNGRWVLVANEGEPADDYSVDPEGSVSVIRIPRRINRLRQRHVRTADFHWYDNHPGALNSSVRIFSPGATVSQDLEPEYIATSNNSKWAWVTLQENNAIGVIHIPSAEFVHIEGLGFKDHSLAGNTLDASNEDGAINMQNWPVKGMYQPDSIAQYNKWGSPFLVVANEGDARDYSGFSEETRIKDLVLDPVAFPNAATLQLEENLGRLKTTTTLGDTDGDGDHDELYSYGARSFSIRGPGGGLVFDSGDEISQILSVLLPDEFGSDDEENGSFDDRSDDKGAEVEGVAVGKIMGRDYAFIGLERIGGVMIYDISNPFAPYFIDYINTRDFAGDPVAGTAGDMSPEGMIFIKANKSPTGNPMLVVSYEVSGTTVMFDIVPF